MHVSLRTCALLALVTLPAVVSAQTLVGAAEQTYTWRGPLGAGGLLTIKNYNGPIEVRAAAGSTAEMRAEKRTRGGGDIKDVAFEVQAGSGNGDVTICAIYRNRNPCDDRPSRDNWNDGDDRRSVTVAMTVLLPRGARLRVATGNGAVTVDAASGDIHASTGNGRVTLSGTSGTVRVSTGNDDVNVRGARSSVRVSTGNGRVSVATSEGPVEQAPAMATSTSP